MTEAKCPHCGGEMPADAAGCAACGRSVLPIPWSRHLLGLPRRAPRAQVLDYARRCFPLFCALWAPIWLLLIGGGVLGLVKVDGALVEHADQIEIVREAMVRDDYPAAAQRGVELVWESNLHIWKSLERMSMASFLAGVCGIIFSVGALLFMRRVLAAAKPVVPAP